MTTDNEDANGASILKLNTYQPRSVLKIFITMILHLSTCLQRRRSYRSRKTSKMFILGVVLFVFISHVGARLLVHTGVGSIQGVPADDGDYTMFLGIPYARVNVSNPFGESIEYEKIDKVYEAFNESVVCPHMRETFVESEDPYAGALDCMRINVYVPNTETEERAVYIYLHGGKFVHGHSGRSFYGPKYLVQHDVIVVSFNYRLGPYGFMCLDIPEIPGNQGLWDQYKAMKWVRDNIRAFGGDPQKVTVGGHSSGSMSASIHLLTKQPRLFRRVVMQSGSATTPGFIRPSNPRAAVNIAAQFGFKTNDTYAALSFLAKLSPETLIKATAYEYEWSPCIEKEFDGVAAFITENPELAEGTNVDGIEILSGFTPNECIYTLYTDSYRHILNKPDVIRTDMEQKFDLHDSNVTEIVNRFYLGDDRNSTSKKYKIVDFFTHFDFVYPLQRELLKYAKHRNTTIYQYLFTYEGGMNKYKRLYNVTEPGAIHSDELGYIFTTDLIPDNPNAVDRRKIAQMTTLWTNFMKYGNPTPVTSELLPVSWPPLTADTVPCLQIDKELNLISRPLHQPMAFWDLFYDAHLDKLKLVAPGE